jgi:transposase
MLDPKLKESAREMRKAGHSIKEIAKVLNVAVGTAYDWLRDIKVDPETQVHLNGRGGRANGVRSHAEKQSRIEKVGLEPLKRKFTTKHVGEISEAQVLAKLLKVGKIVLQPFGDNQRYDLVVDENGTFIRVQCKTGQLYGDKFRFPISSMRWWNRTRRSYVNEADVFAVYLEETDSVYIFKVADSLRNSCAVRLLDTPGYRSAPDHLLKPDKSLLDYTD